MPLAFASSMGGTLTLIGTPPNLVIQDTLIAAGYEKLSFFSFTPIGLICVVTGLLGMLLLRRFLPKREAGGREHAEGERIQKLAKKYQLAQNLYRIQVEKHSPLCMIKLSELDIPARYGLSVIEIRRKLSMKNQFLKTINQEIAGPETMIQEGDVLYVYGPFEQAERFVADWHLTMLDHQSEERLPAEKELTYVTDEVGIAEVMLTPNSRLHALPVKQTGFREKYRINILGIQRNNQMLLHHLKDEKIRFGDLLLVQGTWKDIALLAADQEDAVVIGQPAEESRSVTMDRKAPVAAGVMLFMVFLLVTELIPAVAAIMISAILMVVLGCVRNMEEAYKTVNWESVVLVGGMIPMSIAIEKTGAAALLSGALADSLGSYGPLALLAGTYFVTSLLTLFISNTTCAVLLAPIALSSAIQLGVSPYPFLFTVAISASMCFAVPFSTPPNAMVMPAGRYKFIHYVKVGAPLQLLIGIVMIVVLPLFFPF